MIRIFLLEDDPQLRYLLQQAMRHWGYEVFSYSDPNKFLLTWYSACTCGEQQMCGDILISDIDMPNMRGTELVQFIKGIGCKIPCIALMSGNWTLDDEKIALRADCNILQKPFRLHDLKNWLEDCKQRIQAHRILIDWQDKSN